MSNGRFFQRRHAPPSHRAGWPRLPGSAQRGVAGALGRRFDDLGFRLGRLRRGQLTGTLQQPDEVGDPESLATACGVDARRQQTFGRLVTGTGPLGEGVARRLTALRETDVDELEDLL